MWSERHRPQSVRDMVGNEEPRAAVLEWLAKWKKGTKPLLLVGPPGIGKTTMAGLLAKQFHYDVIGLNASDARSKSRINEVLAPVLGNISVLGAPMIFVDEVDGISGRSDFGGAAALVEVLKQPTIPIILAANDDSHDKMKGIKKAVKTVRFRRIPPRLLRVYLEDVLQKEGAKLGPGLVIKTVNGSRGDIRSMINLAQSLVTGFNPQTETSFESISVEDGINAFFKAGSAREARSVLYSMQIDPREKINAFYSSIVTSDLDPGSAGRYLEVVSRADMLYGRIRRTQNWRLLRYLNDILAELYKKDEKMRYSQYSLSWQLLNRVRWDGAKMRALASAMSARLHVSPSFFVTSCLPYMIQCIKNGSLEPEEKFAEILEKEAQR